MFGCFRNQSVIQMNPQHSHDERDGHANSDGAQRRAYPDTLGTAVPDLPSGAVHFRAVWHYTDTLTEMRSRMATTANVCVQTWPGCDSPTFIRSFLKEQQDHINQFRARLNDWFLRNQVPFLSEERAIELLVNQTRMLSKKCTGPVKLLADQIRDSITNPEDGMQSYYAMEETIKTLQQDATSRGIDIANGIINDAAFAKLRLDLRTPPQSRPTSPGPFSASSIVPEDKPTAPTVRALDII